MHVPEPPSHNDADPISRRDRFRGALLGLAVGDALGTTVEFSAPGSFAPLTDIVGGGPFSLPAGAWTDDTSMALCLADSLLACGDNDTVDQLRRYARWWRDGHRSSIGRCFDIGNATRAALARFEATGEPLPGDAFPDAGGNAPLMRLAPLPMAFADEPVETVVHRAALSARATHGMREAIDATRYLAALLHGALRGESRETLLLRPPYAAELWEAEPLCDAVRVVAAGSYLEVGPPAIEGSGFAPRSLEAALWALSRHDDYRSAVLAAANLGDDADTTAAIAGQLGGALYGEGGIPARWREVVFEGAEISELADGLLAMVGREAGDDAAGARG
jgi:ADP-ribosylglycohydrolase